MVYDLASRRPKHGDLEETFLISAQSDCSTKKEQLIPKFHIYSAFIHFDDYDYALSGLQNLDARLLIPCTDVTSRSSSDEPKKIKNDGVVIALNADTTGKGFINLGLIIELGMLGLHGLGLMATSLPEMILCNS